MTTSPDIFLSYSRDDQARAKLFAEAFKAAGLSVWWDVGLRAGEAYDSVTESALRNAKAVVVLWSKRSVESRWVRAEATLADRNKTLVPAMIEVCDRPIMFELTQTAELMHWQGDTGDASFKVFMEDVRQFVDRAPRRSASEAGVAGASVRGNLPRRLEPLIGREAEHAEILGHFRDASLVTLTGPGGIGKTRLSIEVARAAAGGHKDGAWLVELAPLNDPAGIPGTIARAMGIELRADPASEIIDRLRTWETLIVLDNCEHLIEPTAGLIEKILQQAPGVRFLATSQEVLGLEGERVVRLASLKEAEARQLFERRARAADPAFAITPANEPAVRAICSRLDGIALAIEMAAARAPALGCAVLLQRLDDRFRVLSGGRRTALPRQRTLQATLDWSHSLLKPEEACVFRRLAVFSGGCDLRAACAIAGDATIDAAAVEEAISSLVAKSLVIVTHDYLGVRYRLLETMRAYAQQKLAEAGETQALRRRHAAYFNDLLEPALEAFWGVPDWKTFMVRYLLDADNLVGALDWAFGVDGDPASGALLVSRGFIVFHGVSRFDEFCYWVDRGLAEGANVAGPARDRLLAARLMARMMAGSADLALITQTNDALPAGRDRLARTTALLSASVILALTRSSHELERADKAFADLAWPVLSFACMWRDVAEVLLLRANGTDLGRLRSATDALVAKARAAADLEIIYCAYGAGAASTMPWYDNVDRAIVEARDLVTLALTSKLVIVGGLNLSVLAARLAMALCERAHPGDLDEARQILLELDRRFGLIHVLQRYALLWYSAAAHQPLTRARVLAGSGGFRSIGCTKREIPC
jgi:predicted ATPase